MSQTEQTPSDFTSDLSTDFSAHCSDCAALCCLALAFDSGPSFAHDKPAGLPCHNLAEGDPRGGCSIHKDLNATGYSGCTAYECLGAGQRVTALFESNWKDTPRLTKPMMDAFRIMREVQDLSQMLHASSALPLPPEVQQERRAWQELLQRAKVSLEALQAFEEDAQAQEIKTWLRGLAAHLSR